MAKGEWRLICLNRNVLKMWRRGQQSGRCGVEVDLEGTNHLIFETDAFFSSSEDQLDRKPSRATMRQSTKYGPPTSSNVRGWSTGSKGPNVALQSAFLLQQPIPVGRHRTGMTEVAIVYQSEDNTIPQRTWTDPENGDRTFRRSDGMYRCERVHIGNGKQRRNHKSCKQTLRGEGF
jgi:hypothetical protein